MRSLRCPGGGYGQGLRGSLFARSQFQPAAVCGRALRDDRVVGIGRARELATPASAYERGKSGERAREKGGSICIRLAAQRRQPGLNGFRRLAQGGVLAYAGGTLPVEWKARAQPLRSPTGQRRGDGEEKKAFLWGVFANAEM